ncbi:MAG: hypothetical protein MUP64_13910, partial [Anaerolineae bacterium]|nr:hypothetical protein [Anaerolineae bacterium]
MRTVAIVVGVNHWKDITSPFCWSLREYNPDLELVIVDNASEPPYPADFPGGQTVRSVERLGYNRALNLGIEAAGEADWYICFNNDCRCKGPIDDEMAKLSPAVLYGSWENKDELNDIVFQASAWLVISKRIVREVGLFDEELSAAFEEFDYELRAMAKGFGLATAQLPVTHLDRHTRFEEQGYWASWERSRQRFTKKHGLKTTIMPRPGWVTPQPSEWWRVLEPGLEEFDIDMNAWRAVKPFGISGCFRVCNDAEFLEPAIVSHLPWLDEAVIALQPSTDQTEAIAERLEQKHAKVRIVRYPARPHFIDVPEFHKDPVNSIRSFVYLSNWALAQCRYSWVARIEADVIALSTFGEIRRRIQAERDAWRYYGRVILNVAGRHCDGISKENPRNGGWDEGVFPCHPEAAHFTKAE